MEDSDLTVLNSNKEETVLLKGGDTVNIMWSPEIVPHFDAGSYRVDVTIHIQDLQSGEWMMYEHLVEDVSNSGRLDNIKLPTFSNLPSNVSSVIPIALQVAARLDGARLKSKRQTSFPAIYAKWSLTLYIQTDFKVSCEEWLNSENPSIGNRLLQQLPPCPRTLAQANLVNSGFDKDNIHPLFLEFFHSKSQVCFRQRNVR